LTIRSVLEVFEDDDALEIWWADFGATYDRSRKMLTFRPLPMLQISVVKRRISETAFEFDYVSGPLRGIGVWELSSVGTRRTLVKYSVNLRLAITPKINPMSWRFIRRKHAADILALMNRLVDLPAS
jgi:hypothetical protein